MELLRHTYWRWVRRRVRCSPVQCLEWRELITTFGPMDELFIGPIILPTRSSSDHIMQEYLHFLRKKFVRFRKNTYLCNRKPQKQRGKHSVWCPDGGIGRRVGLKHQCRKACRFDPGSGYLSKQFKISQAADIKALARFFILQQPPICSTFAPQVYPYIFPRCLPDSYT